MKYFIILLVLGFMGCLQNKNKYMIHTSESTYYTSNICYSNSCISFIDEIHGKITVCGTYTIKELPLNK